MNEAAKLSSMIARRRSTRRYRSQLIENTTIERLLSAAGQAPSAHNRQPWRFVVLQDRTMQEALAVTMGERLWQDRTKDGDDPEAIEKDVARSRDRLTEAPAVIVVCVETRDMDCYPDERRRAAEHAMAIQSTAMATQNFLLAAEQENLGACIMCAPLFCPDAVIATLALPQSWEPQMLVTLGFPDKRGPERPRLSLSDIVIWRPGADQAAR